MIAKNLASITSENFCEPAPSVAEHLARTALGLFARKGYTATSVSEIVIAAGVTKPTLYYYYGSKEQLARKLVVDPLESLRAELQRLETTTQPPLAKEVAWLAAQLEFTKTDNDRARFVFALYFGPLGAELADAVAEYGMHARLTIKKIVRSRPEMANWPEERLEDYVRALHGQMISTVIEMLYDQPDSDLSRMASAELAAKLVHDLDNGYLGPTTPESGPKAQGHER